MLVQKFPPRWIVLYVTKRAYVVYRKSKFRSHTVNMKNSLRYSIRATLFGIGLTLSPFTLWNDAFVNAPLTVLLAEPLVYLLGFDRLITYAWAYTATNVLGIALMALASTPKRKQT